MRLDRPLVDDPLRLPLAPLDRLRLHQPHLAGDSQQILKANGFTGGKTDVLAVAVPDRPGGLAKILELLDGAGINVEYMYAFVQRSGDNAIMIFRVDGLDKAIQTLTEAGVHVLKGQELYEENPALQMFEPQPQLAGSVAKRSPWLYVPQTLQVNGAMTSMFALRGQATQSPIGGVLEELEIPVPVERVGTGNRTRGRPPASSGQAKPELRSQLRIS